MGRLVEGDRLVGDNVTTDDTVGLFEGGIVVGMDVVVVVVGGGLVTGVDVGVVGVLTMGCFVGTAITGGDVGRGTPEIWVVGCEVGVGFKVKMVGFKVATTGCGAAALLGDVVIGDGGGM